MNDQENVLSSSPSRPTSRSNGGGGDGVFSSQQKIRKPPTVTPKRFAKFWTPRQTLTSRGNRQSKAGRQLRDITKNGANRRASGLSLSLSLGDDCLPTPDVDADFPSSRPQKRRKLSTIDLSSSPPRSSPLGRGHTAKPIPLFASEPPLSPGLTEAISEAETLPDLLQQLKPFPRAIRRFREPGPSRRILERSFGGYDAISRSFRGPDHVADWRSETANFVSTSDDLHTFRGAAIPFCATSCNTNSLVAVGDEEGSVHLIDSSPTSSFTKTHVKFRVHYNALMDIAFSSDDYVLVTASGDQTARVIDMQSQQTICILSGHKSSVKQVRFRPDDDNIITTSARDGCVMIWDLRCGGKSAVQNFRTSLRTRASLPGRVDPETRYGKGLEVGYGHRSANRHYEYMNRDELSITSFQHLPNGREHMIITSSEVDASVKLWDLRNAGRRNPVPLSSTLVPESHKQKRQFGINTMALSGDGARLYTVCRDATVYAYSTNQLVMGSVPEMDSATSRRRMLKEPMSGLGPLYGFKNSNLRFASFYIKASLRPAKGSCGEMLAVGSTNHTPILFPTDERHLARRERPSAYDYVEHDDDEDEADDLPTSLPNQALSNAPASNFQTFEHGTALVRGHKKEVTSIAWTTHGDLISVSDDCTARCWREDAQKARALRLGEEFGGARWQSGWAEVDSSFDEDDC